VLVVSPASSFLWLLMRGRQAKNCRDVWMTAEMIILFFSPPVPAVPRLSVASFSRVGEEPEMRSFDAHLVDHRGAPVRALIFFYCILGPAVSLFQKKWKYLPSLGNDEVVVQWKHTAVTDERSNSLLILSLPFGSAALTYLYI